MKKKIILLLILITFLSGCSAEYTININDENINDKLKINNNKTLIFNTGTKYTNLIDTYYNQNYAVDVNTPGYPEIREKIEGYKYYNKTKINSNNQYGMELSHNFKINEYKNNPLLTYVNIDYINTNNELTINSNNNNVILFDNFPYLTNIKFTINTNYKVINNNADEIKDNEYIWYISKDNYKNKPIQIKIDKTENNISRDLQLNDKQSEILTIFIIILLSITIFIFVFYTYYNVKNSNK